MKRFSWSRFADKVLSSLAKISQLVIVFVGLAIIIAAVAFSIYTPVKLFAVLVASIGCSLGTGIISLTMTKLAAIKLEESRQRIEKEAKKHAETEERLKKVTLLEMETNNLQSEIERLKCMRIDVNSYRAILKLGVAELDSEVTDFKKEILDDDKREQWYELGRAETTEYIGVLNYRFKAFFGVDLTKLRFKNRDDGKLEVSGFESEFQGMKDVNKEWKLNEIRTKKHEKEVLNIKLPQNHQVLKTGDRLWERSNVHEKEVMNRINIGINLKSLNAQIIKIAMGFLQLLLAPLGKEIVFEPVQNLDGAGFVEYLEFHNIGLDQKITQLEEKKTRYGSLTYSR